MNEICTFAKRTGMFVGSNRPDNTIRNCIYTHPDVFRRSKPRGWWELVSYQEEIAVRDRRIRELEEETARLKDVKTEDDFVRRLVSATRNLFGANRRNADYVRQVLLNLGRDREQEELLEWIQHRDKRTQPRAEKKIVQKITNSQVFNGTVKASEFNVGGTKQ